MKLLDGIVSDVAQSAAEKGRNTGHRHRPVILQQFLSAFSGVVGLPFFDFAVLDDFDLVAARFENPLRPGAEKRIARPALAAFDAFKMNA